MKHKQKEQQPTTFRRATVPVELTQTLCHPVTSWIETSMETVPVDARLSSQSPVLAYM